MKKMKKAAALMFALIMGLAMLTGCGDPVADDFEQFWNAEEMTTIGNNLTDLGTEVDKWNTDKIDDKAIKASLKDVLIPKVDDSLDLLAKTETSTDEVKAIKDKCQVMLETCKDGFETMLDGINKQDPKLINKGAKIIDKGATLTDEFDKAAKDLAEEKGLQFED